MPTPTPGCSPQKILLMLGPTHCTSEQFLLFIHCSILSVIHPDLKSTHRSLRSGGGGMTLPLSSLTSGSMIFSGPLASPTLKDLERTHFCSSRPRQLNWRHSLLSLQYDPQASKESTFASGGATQKSHFPLSQLSATLRSPG